MVCQQCKQNCMLMLRILRGSVWFLLLPQVEGEEKIGACRTKGRRDSCRFGLGIPISLKEGIKLTHTLKEKLISSSSSHCTTVSFLLVVLVEMFWGLLYINNNRLFLFLFVLMLLCIILKIITVIFHVTLTASYMTCEYYVTS